eukprot:4695965-Amphidinium_carterae.2
MRHCRKWPWNSMWWSNGAFRTGAWKLMMTVGLVPILTLVDCRRGPKTVCVEIMYKGEVRTKVSRPPTPERAGLISTV